MAVYIIPPTHKCELDTDITVDKKTSTHQSTIKLVFILVVIVITERVIVVVSIVAFSL